MRQYRAVKQQYPDYILMFRMGDFYEMFYEDAKNASRILGLTLTSAIFALSLQLVRDASWFEPVCMLCLICLLFLYLETAFGICVGCQLYFLAIRAGLMKRPSVAPSCTGDVCQPR